MGITREKLVDLLLLVTFAVFTLGQLPGILLKIHPIDIFIFFILIFTIRKREFMLTSKKLLPLLMTILVSGFVGITLGVFDLPGPLYLLRLLVYLYLIYLLPNRLGNRKELIRDALLTSAFFVAVYGWVQYFLFPNLTSMKLFGWDDHYYRLTSTFLDPAFTGIIFVFGALIVLYKYTLKKSRVTLLLILFFLVSLGFTYSRSSILAFFAGLFVLLFPKYKKLFIVFCTVMAFIVISLPTYKGGEGVKLTRISSIAQKLENYQESIQIISYSPLFGVGYNNVCSVKRVFFKESGASNSCPGLDNSFLFIGATLGVIGLMVFAKFFHDIYRGAAKNTWGSLWKASVVALFVHSIFTNTLFYSWVLFWLVMLTAISRKTTLHNEA